MYLSEAMYILLTVIGSALSFLVAWHAISAVNCMSRETHYIYRAAYVLLGTGAVGIAIYPLWSKQPIDGHLFLIVLALALLSFDRRRRSRLGVRVRNLF